MQRRLIQCAIGAMWYCAPALTRRFVAGTFFASAAYGTTPEEDAWLDRGEPFSIRLHGKEIRGWQWGSGPGILLAHGWNGRGIQFHEFIGPLVESGFRAVAYDAPGHGESEGIDSSYFEFTEAVTSSSPTPYGLCAARRGDSTSRGSSRTPSAPLPRSTACRRTGPTFRWF
jgi:pimeloyl-ACP methyl ester carboxylesterase